MYHPIKGLPHAISLIFSYVQFRMIDRSSISVLTNQTNVTLSCHFADLGRSVLASIYATTPTTATKPREYADVCVNTGISDIVSVVREMERWEGGRCFHINGRGGLLKRRRSNLVCRGACDK